MTVVEREGEFLKVRRRSWARLIARTWLEDPSLCPTCGKEMKVLAAITSPAQDEVIEKILRSRKEWPSGPALRAGLRARLLRALRRSSSSRLSLLGFAPDPREGHRRAP